MFTDVSPGQTAAESFEDGQRENNHAPIRALGKFDWFASFFIPPWEGPFITFLLGPSLRSFPPSLGNLATFFAENDFFLVHVSSADQPFDHKIDEQRYHDWKQNLQPNGHQFLAFWTHESTSLQSKAPCQKSKREPNTPKRQPLYLFIHINPQDKHFGKFEIEAHRVKFKSYKWGNSSPAWAGFKRNGTRSVTAWIHTIVGAYFYLGDIYGSAASAKLYNDGQSENLRRALDELVCESF